MVAVMVEVLCWTVAIVSGLGIGLSLALMKAEGRGPWRGTRR